MPKPTTLFVIRHSGRHRGFLHSHTTLMRLPEPFGQRPGLY